MHNFRYNSYIPLKDKNLKDKTISEFLFTELVIYDYYEEYDENKNYPTTEYTFEYFPNTKRKYINKLVTYQYKNIQYKYVVAYEILNHRDKEFLKKYCQCEKHTANIFNPKRYLLGIWITGCINCDLPSQYVIWKTRQYVKNFINTSNIEYPI